MSSNGKSDEFHPPPIAPAIQAMLDKQRHNRAVEETLRAVVDACAENVLAVYPNQGELVASLFESKAQKIRAEIEAKKREERLHER